MLAPKSLPRCSSGMGVPWSKAGLVRVKFSQVGTRPDERVVSGASVAEHEAEWVCFRAG
jgi:hypothetical protein